MTKKNGIKTKIVIDAVIFDLVLLVGFLVLFWVSFNYNPRARSIPMALGVIGGVMLFLQVLVDVFPAVGKKLRFVSEGGVLSAQERLESSKEKTSAPADTEPVQAEQEGATYHEWLQLVRLIVWLTGFVLLLAYTHYLIAVGLFVVLLTRIEGKESWKRSILLALCVNGGFFVLFDLILKVQI